MRRIGNASSRVCLQCFARILISPNRPLLLPNSFWSSRGTRLVQTATAVSDDDGPAESAGTSYSDAGGTSNVSSADAASATKSSKSRSRRRKKLQGPRGCAVREHDAQLEKLSLGTPVKVVMLRDATAENTAAAREKKKAVALAAREGKGMSADELTRFIGADDVPVGDEKPLHNMDRLRPRQDVTVLSEEAYDDLFKQLVDGFTAKQLKLYVSQRRQTRAPEPKFLRRLLHDKPWRCSPQSAATFRRTKNSSNSALGVPGKPGLAAQVLKQCWLIKSESESQRRGTLELMLPYGDRLLFFEKGHGILKDVAHRYHVDVAAERSSGRVKIEGKEESAYDAAREIKNICQQVQRMSIDLEQLHPAIAHPDTRYRVKADAVSKIISDMTGVIARMVDERRRTLRMCSFGPARTPLEDAQRLLLSYVDAPGSSRALLSSVTEDPQRTTALHDIGSMTHLPWDDQAKAAGARWTRLVADGQRQKETGPEVAETGAPDAVDGKSHRRLTAGTWEFLDRVRRCAARGGGPPGRVSKSFESARGYEGRVEAPIADEDAAWEGQTRTTTVALAGHVLRPLDVLAVPEMVTAKELEAKQDLVRAFSFDVPGLVRSITSLPAVYDVGNQETLVLYLKPSPWARLGGKLSTALPAIEMLLRVDADLQKNELLRVEAVVDQRILDIMLPESASDVRFRTRSTIDMRNPARCHPIADFLRRSHLEVWGQERLKTPAGLSLRIPKWMIAPGRRPALDQAGGDELASSQDIEVEYLFARLELRQSVGLAINGWKAQYVGVEAGKAGGRWGELRFHMEPAPTAPLERESHPFGDAHRLTADDSVPAAALTTGDGPSQESQFVKDSNAETTAKPTTTAKKQHHKEREHFEEGGAQRTFEAFFDGVYSFVRDLRGHVFSPEARPSPSEALTPTTARSAAARKPSESREDGDMPTVML